MAERTYNLTRADITRGYITEADIGTINGVTADFTDLSSTNITVNAIQEIKGIGYDPSSVAEYGVLYVKTDGNIYFVNESGDRFTLNNVSADGTEFILKERSTDPAAPASGYGKIYIKDDNNIYFINDNGDGYQINASSFSSENYFSLGGELPGPYPAMRRCTIDSSTGDILDTTSGIDIMFSSDTTAGLDMELIADKFWNAVWNDVADFQLLYPNEKKIHGKCYYDTAEGAKICDKECQMAVMGIASNTFGFGVGVRKDKAVPIAVAGWTLAYVDKEYPIGTPLMNNANGDLTEMSRDMIKEYPERIVALYKKKEPSKLWGPPTKEIEVDGRHWVKVK